MKRTKLLLAGITVAAAATLATGTVATAPAAPVTADTGWPCPGC